jgi:ATP-binding cassette subfamily B protein
MASPLSRLIAYSHRHKRDYLLASCWSVLNKIFDIAPEVLIGIAIDVVVKREQSWLSSWGVTGVGEQLILLAAITFFIWFFESFFEYLHLVGWRSLAQKIQHDLRIDTYQHVLALDVAYFENQRSGNLVSIMNDDINQLERFLDGGVNAILQTLTVVLVVGGIFFALAPTVAIWSMLPIPIILLGAFYYKRRSEPLYDDVRSRAGNLSARLTGTLAGVITIKSQTAESFEVEGLRSESVKYMGANRDAIRVSSAFMPIIRMAVLAGFLATLLVGGFQALDGQLAVGSFGVLVFLTQRLLWPMTAIASTVDLYQRAMASIRRILDLLGQPVLVKSGTKTLTPEFARKSTISFDLVNFSYPSREHVLRGISFKIEAGRMIALVGATGSGKSTISKLLLHFYEPTSGSLTIGGTDLGDFDTRSLRQMIGFVSQEQFMFDGTVRDNIAYGYPGLSEQQIKAAANAAEATEFIESLPKGFDTHIGERGQKLSGGQKQRLAIARAIVRDPPILVLDEATSAVDNETERLIQRSIQRLAKDRTLLVIAHRLSTIRHADTIHVIDQGAIVESGTHAELVKRGGVYAGLWQIQTGDRE